MILNRQNLYKAQQFLNYMYFNIYTVYHGDGVKQ